MLSENCLSEVKEESARLKPAVEVAALISVRRGSLHKYRCRICGKGYATKKNLYRHTHYECGRPPRFQCPHCSHKCKQKSNVYLHVRKIHPGLEVYAMDLLKELDEGELVGGARREIPAGYEQYSASNAPARDSAIGEYRCNFCNCPYSSQSHLKRHLTRGCFMDPSFPIEQRRMMNRAESRNYVCPQCSQGYKNKRTLDTHLRTACGREPKFQCPYCGLKSKHPPNIYTHIRRRHKGQDLFVLVDQNQA
ncbi:hypothetical protein KM043_007630 [Ampulex compressa]|nr:hypothetical protein KM043_007630 [Ampulex compressa]